MKQKLSFYIPLGVDLQGCEIISTDCMINISGNIKIKYKDKRGLECTHNSGFDKSQEFENMPLGNGFISCNIETNLRQSEPNAVLSADLLKELNH